MSKRILMTMVILPCLIVVVVGCRSPNPPVSSTPYPGTGQDDATYTVQRGRVVRSLSFTGRVSPEQEVPLYFETPGYVDQVHVNPGDRVQAGDLLAQLVMSDLLNQISQAQVNLESAQLLVSEAEDALEQEIALAELSLSEAEMALDQAQRAAEYAIIQAELALELARAQLTRAESLEPIYDADIIQARVGVARARDHAARARLEYQESLDREWEPQELRDAYARELQSAEWALDVALAQSDRAVASKSAYQQDLKVLQMTVRQAQAELDQFQGDVDPRLSLHVQRAQLILDGLKRGVDPVLLNDVNRARLALDRLQEHLTDARIVAPQDGIVVSLSLSPGHPVEPFRTVLVIADPSAIEVSASLPEAQLQELIEGQEAIVVLSTDLDQHWTGTIHCLPYPYGLCGSTDELAGLDRTVRIRLDGPTGDLRIGALTEVSIVLAQKDGVLWLPPEAVQTFQDRQFVILYQDGRQRRIDVELGIEGQDQVEILKGVQEGQVVVVP